MGVAGVLLHQRLTALKRVKAHGSATVQQCIKPLVKLVAVNSDHTPKQRR